MLTIAMKNTPAFPFSPKMYMKYFMLFTVNKHIFIKHQTKTLNMHAHC